MGQGIFADESARERDTDGRQSIFRRREQDGTDAVDDVDATDDANATEDVAAAAPNDDAMARARADDGTDDGTMTVFSGDEVFEVEVDDG